MVSARGKLSDSDKQISNKHFSFCVALYSKKLNKQVFIIIQCKTICRYYLRMHNKFYSIQRFYLFSKTFIFPIVKMAAKYAKVDRIGSLDAGF